MAYIVRSFTPCFTLWFDVGICSLRDTSHNVYPTDVYPFSWVQLMSPLSLDLDAPCSYHRGVNDAHQNAHGFSSL